jgi:hypothetical protein
MEQVLELLNSSMFGVDYERAHALGPSALPFLEQVLETDSRKQLWEVATTAMVFVGGRDSFEYLRAFTWDRFHGEVDIPTFAAIRSAHSVLGLIESPEVLEYLERHTDPGSWTGIPWHVQQWKGEGLSLHTATIGGLSYSSHPRAALILSRLPESSNVASARERQAFIMEKGILEYCRELRRRGHDGGLVP